VSRLAIYAGLEKDKTALLYVVRAREDGEKELLGMEPGYRGSKESWVEILRDLGNRGLEAPLTAIGDGALDLWAALSEVYPTNEHQRCWNYRTINVQAKLAKCYQGEASQRLKKMYKAPTQKEYEELRDRYVTELGRRDQRAAAETLLRDWKDFVNFYHHFREHWIRLRTTNPIESIFSGVRLRTDVGRRIRRWDNALYLVFKTVERLGRNRRTLDGGANLMTLVLEGHNFKTVFCSEKRYLSWHGYGDNEKMMEGMSTTLDKNSNTSLLLLS